MLKLGTQDISALYLGETKIKRAYLGETLVFEQKPDIPPGPLEFAYTGEATKVVLYPGVYRLEVWGAQGGYRSGASYAGKGGYSVGSLNITRPTTVFVRVGGSGNTGKTAGGFNGGGRRGTYNGGGGASDIRIGVDDLNHRVIVAGGGGSDGGVNKPGKYGGGEAGGDVGSSGGTNGYGTGGYGGTQTGNSGGASWVVQAQSTTTTADADAKSGFGFGGNGVNKSSGFGGAGGGGWYGGAGRVPDSSGDDDGGGGGGSGFVWVGKNAPEGFALSEEHYLTNAQTVNGAQSFLSPDGASETGHSGDGYARITPVVLYRITVLSEDTEKGTVLGGGTYESGMQVTVKASPIRGYKLSAWQENGQTVSESAEYTFTVTGDRTLTAVFEEGSPYEAGVDWWKVDNPLEVTWKSITYGNGKFVAVSSKYNFVVYSVDGISWTMANLPSSGDWRGVTYGNGKFVVIKYNTNKAAYSTDGINWSESTLPVSGKWLDMAYGNGKFVAVAYSSNTLVYSTDGVNWAKTTLPSGIADCSCIAYGADKFVAIAGGNSDKAAYSMNGIDWHSTNLPSSSSWKSVTYGNDKFVAIHTWYGEVAYSEDGINWVKSTMLPESNSNTSRSYSSVTYGEGKFVAVGPNTSIAAYSKDGINWIAVNLPSSKAWYDVAYGDGKFVATAFGAEFAYSSDYGPPV